LKAPVGTVHSLVIFYLFVFGDSRSSLVILFLSLFSSLARPTCMLTKVQPQAPAPLESNTPVLTVDLQALRVFVDGLTA
jgi:hypothetical protein